MYLKHLTYFTKPTNITMANTKQLEKSTLQNFGEKIMFKENPKAGNLGLEKPENGSRSKFPGCYDIIQPAIGRDGRWKTGLDEDSVDVNTIPDAKEREARKKQIKAERESLERLLNQDLSGTSKFWESYFVTINTKKPLDMSNPLDRVAYHVILASGEAAPSHRDAETEVDYLRSKYYIARENEDVSIKVERKRKYNEAISEFMDLMKAPDQALLVGRYLGLPIKESTPQNNVFDIFQNFLDSDDKLGSVDKFLFAIKKSPEELGIKMVLDDAMKKKVIRVTKGLFQRGNITMGKSIPEVLQWLSDPANSGELASIQEEIALKNKFGG